jgi:hypothetical protein
MPATLTTPVDHLHALGICTALVKAGMRATTGWDRDGETWAVRIPLGAALFELLIPQAGAMYGLYRNGSWLGGVNLRRGEVTAAMVACRVAMVVGV